MFSVFPIGMFPPFSLDIIELTREEPSQTISQSVGISNLVLNVVPCFSLIPFSLIS